MRRIESEVAATPRGADRDTRDELRESGSGTAVGDGGGSLENLVDVNFNLVMLLFRFPQFYVLMTTDMRVRPGASFQRQDMHEAQYAAAEYYYYIKILSALEAPQ